MGRTNGIPDGALVWDAHSCLPLRYEIAPEGLHGIADAGVHFVSINVGMDYNPWPDMLRLLASFRAWILARPDRFVLADRIADVEQAQRDGKTAVAFDIEGATMLDGDMGLFRLYRDLGVRQIHLAYNNNNAYGGGCHDAENGKDVGLTELGRRVVATANEIGVTMDCSHSSYRTSMEVMERSAKPVVFSHANVRRLWDHPRNLRDDQIRACAATGGVVGIMGISRMLGPDADTVEAMVRHIEDVAALVGPAHVGIGLDDYPMQDVEDWRPPNFEPEQLWPSRWYGGERWRTGAARFPDIARKLQERGWDAAALRGVLGENFLRVSRACWLD
jgi:membrane dipeptidase